MENRIEDLIDEIERYVDGCRPKAFSGNSQIIVDKDQIDELLRDLRLTCPKEIQKYQKIVANQDAIISAAKEKAQNMIDQATEQTSQLVNEHEIMQQAYAQANEVVTTATKRAQEVMDNGVTEANQMREASIEYMDEMLGNFENVLSHAITNLNQKHKEYVDMLNGYLEIARQNRASLHPVEENTATEEGGEKEDSGLDVI